MGAILRILSLGALLLFFVACHTTGWADDYSNQLPDSDARAAQLKVSNWKASVVVQEADDGSGPICLPSVSFTLQNLGTDLSTLVVHADFLNRSAKSVFSSNDYVVDSIPAGFSKDIEIDAPQGSSAATGGCVGLPELTVEVTAEGKLIAKGAIDPALPDSRADNSQPPAPELPTPPNNFDQAAIQSEMMQCWPFDTDAIGAAGFSVHLLLRTDSQGTVRSAVVAPVDQNKMDNATFSALADQAINAVTNYQCSTLPLPNTMLGKPQKFEFLFKPDN